MNIHERLGSAGQRIENRARKVTEVFAPGDASFGELVARATVDGIPVGISLAMIRGVAAGNYEVLILAPFLIPVSLMMAIGVHYHINEARENSRKIQGK